ncbi:MAG: patatin-like phospholipase family protein [Bacteroidaceae bacterium]|nr:patatin-like phospholipase family protein [Bacteroidaceae bacterium]
MIEKTEIKKVTYQTGFALSGGFIKGFAHLGVIQALKEKGITPDVISGVSAGALAGVFIADGQEPHDVVRLFVDNKSNSLTSWARRTSGLYKLDTFIDFIGKNLRANRLEDLQIPLIVTATDLDHGKSIHFQQGSIAERVAASCCMPIMFSPVEIDEINYVDGGVFNNLPVSVIRDCCEHIAAINVSPLVADEYKKNFISIAKRSYDFMFQANTIRDREIADLLIEPYNLAGYSNREIGKAEEIFEQGFKTGTEVLNKLMEEKGTIWGK